MKTGMLNPSRRGRLFYWLISLLLVAGMVGRTQAVTTTTV
jgi:hypothetical protein